MALRMASLKRTPSGLWTSRKVIPEDVREAYGKREEKPTWPASLTQREATLEFTAWLHETEARIENIRQRSSIPVTGLTTREISALVGAWYHRMVDRFEEAPGPRESWEHELEQTEPSDPHASPEAPLWTPTEFASGEAYRLLEANRLVVTAESQERLLQAVLEAYRGICRLMIKRGDGDYSPDPLAATFASPKEAGQPLSATQEKKQSGPRLTALFDGYVKERQPAPATVKSFKGKVAHLIQFLGHEDAAHVSPEDIVRWKDHLLNEQLTNGQNRSATTVGDTYLPAIRTVYAWALTNQKVKQNPVSGLNVKRPKVAKLRGKDFTDAEAHLILKASLEQPASRSEYLDRAKRWVPWLCAYSGARVNEITQLRPKDVVELDGIWCIHITPEAGNVKTNEARIVPLHSHLIEQGFVEFAKKQSAPLFYNPANYRGGSDGNPQAKKAGERLANWVRSLGISDPNIAPNHAWRHRFKTMAREYDIDHEARDYLAGHTPATEGAKYGGWSPRALKREIEKLPAYQISSM